MNAALRRTLQVSTWAIAIALVALPVVAVLNGWIGAERWPLRTLRVNDGLERVDTARLRETLLPYATSGFFAVKLDPARAAVARLPWVEHAEVRKRWPDVLEVRIVEHRPFARWGDDRLLSEQGRLFPVAGIEVPDGLPQLAAADTRVPGVVARYNESRAMFAPGGVAVERLALDSRDSWSLTLDNGVEVVVGSQEARLRLKRFARVLPQLLARNPQLLQRADLRYTNGFALEWAKPGIGSRESGTGGAADPIAGLPPLPPRPAIPPLPAPPITDSRFPIPGSRT